MFDIEKQQLNDLIIDVANGDMQALDGIFFRVSRQMTAVALSIVGDRMTAEDVVSDSFVKIVKFAKKYQQEEPLGWILRIVRNTALDAVRARGRKKEVGIENSYSIVDQNYSYEKRVESLELENAINRLAEDERKGILLRYFYDMTIRDVAKELHLTKSSAERLLRRAEENLKILLNSGKNVY